MYTKAFSIRKLIGTFTASGLLAASSIIGASSADAASYTTGFRMYSYITRYDMGKPYVYGTDGPRTFDCSGLIYSAAHKVGDYTIPRTSEAQQRNSKKVPYRHRRVGDLVFFGYPAYHVGIYAGVHWYQGKWRSMMVDAPHSGTSVREEPVYYSGSVSVSYGSPS